MNLCRLLTQAVAVEDLVKPRSFISCSNLIVRPDDRLQCPSLTFTELSTLTLKPREPHLRTALNHLQQSIPVCTPSNCLNTVNCTVEYLVFVAINFHGFRDVEKKTRENKGNIFAQF